MKAAALEEERGPYAWAVVQRKALDVEYDRFRVIRFALLPEANDR